MKRREWVMLGSIVVLLFALSWQSTRHRSARRALRVAQLTREAACGSARFAALNSLRSGIREEKLYERRGDPSSKALRSRNELGIYVFACVTDRDDVDSLDMAAKLRQLVVGLFAVGDIATLEDLATMLEDTPLEQWKGLALPEEPSLFMQLSRGDAQEAEEMERAFEATQTRRE